MESRFVATLLKLGANLTRTGGRLVAPLGISQQQSVILITVDQRGPLSQKAIRNALLYERSNVSKAVSQLAALGLIKTRQSTDDRRVVILETTAKGHNVAEACLDLYDRWNRDWLTGVPKKELRQALALLERLAHTTEST